MAVDKWKRFLSDLSNFVYFQAFASLRTSSTYHHCHILRTKLGRVRTQPRTLFNHDQDST